MSAYTFKCRIWGAGGGFSTRMHYPDDSSFHISMEGAVSTCYNGSYGGGITDTYGGTEPEPGMIVLLFIGLKDVNGKDIYAGDVIGSLDSAGKQIRHLVQYLPEEARFCLSMLPYERYPYFQDMRVSERWITGFQKEVIGNMYEHPELLK